MLTTPSRTFQSNTSYGPFGEPYGQDVLGGGDFTGQGQNFNLSTYDFSAREYGIQGRWPSPDPAGLAAVDPMDPQTWNRYAYVRNSPLEFIDPFGLCNGRPPNPARPCWLPPPPSAGGGCLLAQFFISPITEYGSYVCVISSPPSTVPTNPTEPSTEGVPISEFDKHLAKEFKKPGCLATNVQAGNKAIDFLPALPSGSDISDAAEAAGQSLALSRVVSRGLVVPLRSSFVRDVVAAGEDFAVAYTAVPIIYAQIKGIQAQISALHTNGCDPNRFDDILDPGD